MNIATSNRKSRDSIPNRMPIDPIRPAPAAQKFDYTEFFAGAGWVNRCMKGCGLNTAAFDINYGPNPRPGKQDYMDLLSDAGFALLFTNDQFHVGVGLVALIFSYSGYTITCHMYFMYNHSFIFLGWHSPQS